MVSSGMESLYHTSGGLTLDRELVSTTGSGCRSPILTEKRNINFTNLPKQWKKGNNYGFKPDSHCAILNKIWLSETNFENPKRFL